MTHLQRLCEEEKLNIRKCWTTGSLLVLFKLPSAQQQTEQQQETGRQFEYGRMRNNSSTTRWGVSEHFPLYVLIPECIVFALPAKAPPSGLK